MYQVVTVDQANVDAAPSRDDHLTIGVVKRDDDFVIWADPQAAHSG